MEKHYCFILYSVLTLDSDVLAQNEHTLIAKKQKAGNFMFYLGGSLVCFDLVCFFPLFKDVC